MNPSIKTERVDIELIAERIGRTIDREFELMYWKIAAVTTWLAILVVALAILIG